MELNKDNIYNEYIIKKQNIDTVAKIFGVSRDVIKKRLKKFNIHKNRKDVFWESKKLYDKTMLERYGTISPIKNAEIKEKIRKTNIKKYGVEHVTQSKEIMQKIKRTNFEKSGWYFVFKNSNFKEKFKATWLERYGVDNPAKSDRIKAKIEKTNIQKYGTKNPGNLPEIVAKIKKTNIKKYGVDYTGRLKEFRIKSVKTSKNTRSKIDGKRFDSSYERDFYDYCLKNGIKIEDMQIPIEYEYNGRTHITFIDFKVNGTLVECKGGHLLKGVFDCNLNIPISKKMAIYEENNVKIITDDNGIEVIRKSLYKIDTINIDFFKKRIDILNML